jgi:hypothetical protein
MSSLPNLTDEFIANSYKGVLHTANQPVTGTEMRQVYDGSGNPTPLKISQFAVGVGDYTLPTTGSLGDTLIFDANGNLVAGSIFPVGSVYFTSININPSSYLGGTWVRVAEGRFIAGVGTGSDGTYSETIGEGNSVGSYKHQLTIDEMPSHDHALDLLTKRGADIDNDFHTWSTNRTTPQFNQETAASGGDQPHNNTPPSFGLYVWSRTA